MLAKRQGQCWPQDSLGARPVGCREAGIVARQDQRMQTARQPQGQRIGARRRIAGPVQNAVGNRAFARIIGQQPQHACCQL